MEENKNTEKSTKKKEKLPVYIDENGNRRDPNRAGHPILCSAKSKRTGKLCMNIAMKNGKCRNHGGLSTGPKTKEGKRRVAEAAKRANTKTGEFVPIWFDTLTPEEKRMIIEELIPKDASELLDQEIVLITVRERRMMNSIKELQERLDRGEYDVSIQENWKRQLKRDEDGEEMIEVREDGSVLKKSEMVLSGKVVLKDDLLRRIQDIEEALTRVQTQKIKLIELKHKLSEGNIQQEDGSLSQLVSILNKAREKRDYHTKGKKKTS